MPHARAIRRCARLGMQAVTSRPTTPRMRVGTYRVSLSPTHKSAIFRSADFDRGIDVAQMTDLACPFKVLFSLARFAEQREWMTEAVSTKPDCILPPGTYFGLDFSRMVLTDLKHDQGQLEVNVRRDGYTTRLNKISSRIRSRSRRGDWPHGSYARTGHPYVQFDRYSMKFEPPSGAGCRFRPPVCVASGSATT